MTELFSRLLEFASSHHMTGRGPLSVALVVTRLAKQSGLPIQPESLLTGGGGQVSGLGRSAVQTILRDHGIERLLAHEGGRTSRGSVGIMREYVSFLNRLHDDALDDLDAIETWWTEKVLEFFAADPFILRFDPTKSIRASIRELMEQTQERQRQSSGTTYSGTVLQHLVGAKLDLILKEMSIEHHGASVSDETSQRDADFMVEDVAIHVTTMPGEAVIQKCQENLSNGRRPLIITVSHSVPVAEGLAEQAGISDRIDVFDAEQFLAGNLYELGHFSRVGRENSAKDLINRYNEIVMKCETDPSLRINLA